jgi:hypothetical protein
MRGTAHAGNALRAEGRVEQRRRGGAVGRHEPLSERDDARAARHAEAAQLLDRLADALGGHGQKDQVRPRERVLLSTEELHTEVARQLDTGEIALVVVGVGELARLLGGAAQESRAKPGALEQHGDRRAERPGPDDRGTTRMLAGIADAARR